MTFGEAPWHLQLASSREFGRHRVLAAPAPRPRLTFVPRRTAHNLIQATPGNGMDHDTNGAIHHGRLG